MLQTGRLAGKDTVKTCCRQAGRQGRIQSRLDIIIKAISMQVPCGASVAKT
jgi:hypothetical protein